MIDQHQHKAIWALIVCSLCGVSAGPELMPVMETRWGENLVGNASFDDGLDGWSVRLGARQDGDVVRSLAWADEGAAHSGSRSLHMTGDSKTTLWIAFQSDPIPIEPGTRYRLEGWMKTEDVQQDEGQYLNSNFFVQFVDADGAVVQIGESPVRATRPLTGTQDWTKVTRIVKAPEGSTHARVGCALTCSGRAWFDDVGLHEGLPIAWTRLETERVLYFYEGLEGPPADAVASNQQFLESLEKMLDLRYKGKVHYYKYATGERKAQITGASERSHHEGVEIHSTNWVDRHDMAHVLMNSLGKSIPLLAEGIAIYCSKAIPGRDAHRRARILETEGPWLPLDKLFDPDMFQASPAPVSNALAGSFVGFLLDRYGADRFKKLYTYESAEEAKEKLPERFRTLYGLEIIEVEQAWREFLAPRPPKPSP